MLKAVEKYRVTIGNLGTDSSYGANGMFMVPMKSNQVHLCVIISNEAGWEHVSVSMPSRTPTWDEMHFIKKMFWDDEDVVLQYHPPEKEFINFHSHCLHMWHKIGAVVELPPIWMV